MTKDHPTTTAATATIEISGDIRESDDDDFEGFSIGPFQSGGACSSNIMMQQCPTRDARIDTWNSPGCFSYAPSRLQQRLSLPPLEVDDFPYFNFEGSHNALEEILSIASDSQELVHSSNYTDNHFWLGSNYSHLDEFTSLLESNEGARRRTQTSDGYELGEASTAEPTKLVEVRGLEEEEFMGTLRCDSTEV